MKRALLVASVLVIAGLAANFLLHDAGWVALRFSGFLVQMSVPTVIVLLVALYFAVRLIVRAVNARRLWAEGQAERRKARARQDLSRGLLAMSSGDWNTSEDLLTRSARDADAPAAHYVVAARAAELQGHIEQRDQWLTRALEADPEQRQAVLIMQAELHLRHQQPQAALAALEQLEATGEQNARGLMLLARVFRQTGDWQRLQSLEPRLRDTGGIPTSFVDETVAQVYLDRLKAAAGRNGEGRLLTETWDEMPKSLRHRPEIVVACARAAMTLNDVKWAEQNLRELIESQWDEAAVLAYGELESREALVTLERAERWLDKHAEDASLLLACARLCIRAELYGKARSYLETSIAIRPRLESYQLLASLMEQLGERERAMKALSDGLAHAIGRKPNLPKIRARRWSERRSDDRRSG
jgi:HemY protein